MIGLRHAFAEVPFKLERIFNCNEPTSIASQTLSEGPSVKCSRHALAG